MSATFFKSENVNIFPCARRGNYTEGGTNKTYNAESRFVSEANLTKLSGLAFGRDSYIISRPAEETAAAGIWKLVIKGYYFEIGVEENELQSEGYFIIGLEDTGCIPRIRLAALTDSSDSLAVNTDATFLDVDGSCNAICFSTVAPATGALYYVHSEDTLKNLDESYANLSMSETLSGIDARLEVIEGEGEGSVKKALIDANTYANSLNTAMDTRVSGLETADAAQATLIANNTQAIATEVAARDTAITDVTMAFQSADHTINDKIGEATDGKEKATVYGAIAKAQAETEDKVDALAKGQVNTNKVAIEALKTAIGLGTQGGSGDTSITDRVAQAEGNIEALEGKVKTLVGSEEGDASKSVRAIAAEETAAIVAGANEKYDTLKEIADFLLNDTTGAAAMANDIQGLKAAFAEDGCVTQAEADIKAVEGRAKKLEAIVAGYGAEGNVYATVNAHVATVSDRAEAAHADINDLNKAVFGKDAVGTEGNEGYESATPGLKDKVEALENTVGNADSGLVKDVAANVTDIGDLTTRVGTAESNITALQRLTSGYTGEGAIKAAIEEAKKAGTEAADAVTNLQNTCLSKTDVEGNKLGIYAVAFDLSKGPEDLSPEFKEATSRPIVFISECSTLPDPPEGYAWFDSLDEGVKVETISTNIILYLKEISSPEEGSGGTSEA
jgi:hypothetical protein